MKRLITGVVLAVVTGGCFFWGSLPLIVFLTVAGLGALYELRGLINDRHATVRMMIGMMGYLGLMGYSYMTSAPPIGYMISLCMVYAWLTYELWCKKLVCLDWPSWGHLKYFFYIYTGFSSLYFIRMRDEGMVYCLILIACIGGTDTLAYYGGRRFGRRPLSHISPKKTWEGAVIGIGGATALMGVMAMMAIVPLWSVWMAPVIGALGQTGDLYESLIKRTHGAKDSSQLLPGHGGILDRADALLFVSPLLYGVLVMIQ